MRLRPATPLTLLLLASFILLLLATISTPIVKSIPIASFDGVNFGVFGYCPSTGACSGIKVGYTTGNGLFTGDQNPNFSLPASTRHSLSSLLIVHPIAAFLNLLCLGLAVAAHFHSPSHSARYLLGLLILLLPTLLVTLLAFLVDILLFVPHLQWGGWIVLVSTILITAAGVVTCAMRRTLVSRKARKKRIAENAEMSGENFYNRQNAEDKMMTDSPVMTEVPRPMVHDAPLPPSFSTFNAPRPQSQEDRQPLNAVPGSGPTSVTAVEPGRYYGPSSRSNSRPPPAAPLNEFGNPIPGDLYGPPPPRNPSRDPSRDGRNMSPYRDNAFAPARGGASIGPPRGRGGYPPRGGFAPRGSYGARGPPPPQGYGGSGGYPGRGRGGFSPITRDGIGAGLAAGTMAAGAGMMAREQRPNEGYPPRSMSRDRYSPPDAGAIGMATFDPVNDNRYRAPSPSNYDASPVGSPVEDYRRQQSPARSRRIASPVEEYRRQQSPARSRANSYGSRAQTPTAIMRQPSPPPMPAIPSQALNRPREPVSPVSPVSRRSQDQYVPVRAQWNTTHDATAIQPENHNRSQSSPPMNNYVNPSRRQRVSSRGSDIYYEDVDPRFADEAPVPQIPQEHLRSNVPQLLAPPQPMQSNPSPESINAIPHQTHSYEDLPGARSPADSDVSNFTSVSQRGVNPNWRPGMGMESNFNAMAPYSSRQRQPNRTDVLLADNPDFSIPGMGPQARFPARGRGGYRGGPVRGGGPGMNRLAPASAIGMDGPYGIGAGSMREI